MTTAAKHANVVIFSFIFPPASGINSGIMSAKSPAPGFIVWATDKTAHGPVELPMLVSWIKSGQVTAGT